jgi:chromosome segregation ATPase
MRDFYEDKLRLMEETLNEKESEREELISELRKLKTDDHASRSLKERLKEKEDHIANLRRRQKELIDLTAVSSRNDTEISKLQTDVQSMKKKKADLQKQLNEERKTHSTEVKKLQKTAMQKDRELNKIKRISSQKEAEAKMSAMVAKARLDELGQLRNKYKDAEKKLRLLSVKRGVMVKAGLDPVLVGRRDNKRIRPQASSHAQTNGETSGASRIDPDAVRDYFDKKVATIARKEALVEKLAHEWEEHFELTMRRQELDASHDDEAELELQALGVRIQFKEDRIRQLAQRLSKQQQPVSSAEKKADDAFLFDSEFAKLCGGKSCFHTCSLYMCVFADFSLTTNFQVLLLSSLKRVLLKFFLE